MTIFCGTAQCATRNLRQSSCFFGERVRAFPARSCSPWRGTPHEPAQRPFPCVYAEARVYPSMRTFLLSPAEARKFNRGGIVRAARQRVFANHQSSILDMFVKTYAGEEQRIIA